MGDERGPWIGSAWMVSTVARGDRPRPRVVVTWAVGVAVLLGVLGAAGPHPRTAALPLPPVDTSLAGATGRVPDAGPAPLPEALPADPGGLPSLGGPGPGPGSGSGVPETMLAAYRGAESSLAAAAPDCHLSWALVAGIGKVESGHAYGGAVSADGTTESPILGPQLDGTGGNASIADTDGGALDHDAVWDRAVGPTQFIPTSWRTYGADGNGDGVADPDNAFDATLATGRYLCAGGTDLATASGRHDAVFRYNHSEAYVATVLRWADAYASGALPVPDTEGGIPDAVLASGDPTLASGDPTLAVLPRPFPTTGAPAAPSGAGLLGGSPVPAGVPSASASPLSAPVLPGAVAPPAGSPALVPGTSASVPGPSSSVPGPSSSVPGPSSGAPVLPGPPSSTPAGSSSSTPAGPLSAPGVTAPRPSTPRPATPTTTTPPASTTPPSSSSTPPASTTTTSSTTTSTTPPRTASPSPAQRCTASLPAVAKAFDVPVTELTAATDDGPKGGQVTCTVSRGGKPLVVAVAAATASAPAPAPGAGVSRTVPGDRVVLSVPPAAKVPAATATAALTKLAPAWA